MESFPVVMRKLSMRFIFLVRREAYLRDEMRMIVAVRWVRIQSDGWKLPRMKMMVDAARMVMAVVLWMVCFLSSAMRMPRAQTSRWPIMVWLMLMDRRLSSVSARSHSMMRDEMMMVMRNGF